MIKKETHHLTMSYLWVILGMALCIASVRMGLGSLNSPEAGFLPFLTGCLLVLLGLVLVVSELGRRKKEGEGEMPEGMFSRKGILSLLAMFLYAAALGIFGFIVSTFFLLLALFKIMESRKWFAPLFISAATVVLSYFIFCVWLRVNFPKGILGIG